MPLYLSQCTIGSIILIQINLGKKLQNFITTNSLHSPGKLYKLYAGGGSSKAGLALI